MANLHDYLDMMGAISFDESPFGEVDGLVISQLVYSDLSAAVAPMSLSKAIDGREGMFPGDKRMLAQLSAGRRFRDLTLTDFENQIDPDEGKQFAAVTALLPDGTIFVAYRGTDSTFVGWKEDFNLAFDAPVPSQIEAVRYLERAANRYPGKIRVGGHSKGGNLAVYAAAMCDQRVQERVCEISNNDGPGHDETTFRSAGYARITGRLRTYIPQSSIVGMLLEHSDDYVIVRSNSTGILQHSPFTWQVENGRFVRVDRRSIGSVQMDETLRRWIAGMSMDERRDFTDALFALLSAGDTASFRELVTDWKDAPARISEMGRIGKRDGKLLLEVGRQFVKTAAQVYTQAAISEAEDLHSAFARLRTVFNREKDAFLTALNEGDTEKK